MKLAEKLEKILDNHFPDEMDSTMLHPNLPSAIDEVLVLFKRTMEEVISTNETDALYGVGELSAERFRNELREEQRKRLEELLM